MFDRKKNILVTGANGQLGSYLVDYFRKKSFYKSSWVGKVFGIDKDDLDISDAEAVASFFNKNVVDAPVDIEYAIHCAAATDTAAIEKDPYAYYATNALGARNVAESCAYNGIKMIFISTDYVLSERSVSFGCNAQEFPVNQYGLQKLIAEQFVKQAYERNPKDCAILRPSWMFGNSRNSFVEKFLKNVFSTYSKAYDDGVASKDAKPAECVEVKVADDAYGRPTPVWLLARIVEDIIMDKRHGTIDAQYSNDQINRWTWAKYIWDAFTEKSLQFFVPLSDNKEEKPCSEAAIRCKDAIEEMIDMIKVVPASSSEIGIKMHHPGHVSAVVDARCPDTTCYINDVSKYVQDNIVRLVQLMKDTLGIKDNEGVC